MKKSDKPKCGLVLLESVRFQGLGKKTAGETYDSRVERKAQSLVKKLSGEFDIIYPGMVSSIESVENIIKLFVAEDVDFIIAVFMSWSEDFAWVRFLRDIPDIPMIFYLPVSSGPGFNDSKSDDDFIEFLAAGGLVGHLEGAGSIKRINRKVRIIVGEKEESLTRIKCFGTASKARSVLKNARFGLIASLNECMWSTYVDPFNFFVRVGPELNFISYNHLKEEVDKVTDKEAKEYVRKLTEIYKVSDEIDQVKFLESARASIGIVNLAIHLKLDAVVLNDITAELHRTLGLRPGFYHPAFNENLSVLLPEGDVGASAIALALKIITKKHINFVEPFYIEGKNNCFAAGHAGPNDHTDSRFSENVIISSDTRNAKQPFKYAGAPFAWYRIPAGQKTFAHFSECKGNYKIITALAESLPGKHILSGYSHSIFKTEIPVKELFEKIIDIGATQHFACVDGDVRKELEEFAFICGFEYYGV